MKFLIPVIAILSAVTSFAARSAGAAPADSTISAYQLDGGKSSYATGCFGPCACPILESPMQGTFRLKRGSVDPMFQNYDVLDVQWKTQQDGHVIPITGSGKYRVGGEVAVMQQMTLDLVVGNGPARHFDSGLIQGGGQFPSIDITISLHGETQCTDTVMHVVASPAVAGVEQGLPPYGLRKVIPNPFHGETDFDVRLRESGPVSLTIYDAQGRVVRNLLDLEWLEAGSHVLRWDGRNDAGRDVTTGRYYARLVADGREYRKALVKRR
jgi:hypothetical protein